MVDLPSEDPNEPGLPDQFHEFQPQLLRLTRQPPRWQLDQMFITADLNRDFDLEAATLTQ
jgi:hypothetical protein